ncbi:2-dehydropantoate 2-reductase [Bacillus salacetis]|uniref:2-dehydropantoate 2-reductase n=1 Tax=Bacillus salacetis TaxID=2315464 RepID=UPI003B9F8FDD
MKVGVIGGGAIGMLYAAYLGKNLDVTLYVRRSEQKNLINNIGIILQHQDTSETISIKAVEDYGDLPEQDLIIIAVKQYHLSELIKTLNKIPPDCPLLFLQNGIGHMKLLEQLSHANLYVGTVEHGALKLSDNEVAHKGKGKTNAAVFRGNGKMLSKLSRANIDFPVIIQSDYDLVLLEKLAVNAVINPLTAVLGIQNGRLVENEHFEHLAQSIFDEILLLYPRLNSIIDFEDIKEIASNTRGNTSSMLADLQTKRETEVEAILGAMLEEARSNDVSLSIIPVLYEMVKGLDKERRKG